MDKFRIDSHKLLYHLPLVARWSAGETVYPIYMEVSPAGACNHRCSFCALDFMEYRPVFLDTGMWLERVTEMGRLGVRSIMYAGEGEPFLHNDIAEIVTHTRHSGIDVALTSNAVLLDATLAEQVLPHTSWIKVSINAGTAETYARVHRTKPRDFDRVLDNIGAAVAIRARQGSRCVLGMQILLLPENQHEVTGLARTARDLGADYLVVKPYSQHLQSGGRRYQDAEFRDLDLLAKELSRLNSDRFQVVFRHNAMSAQKNEDRDYSRCLALPFWSYVDSDANVWGCSAFLGREEFCYGNLGKQTYQQIWEGERRRHSLEWVERDLDVEQCRLGCRMHAVNKFLWEISTPPDHVNFI